jgi:hypothetical protein
MATARWAPAQNMLAVTRQCPWLRRDGLPHRIFWLSRGSVHGYGAMGSRTEYFGCHEAVLVAPARWAPAQNILAVLRQCLWLRRDGLLHGILWFSMTTTPQPRNHTTKLPHNHTSTHPHNHTITQPHNHATNKPHNHTTAPHTHTTTRNTQPHNHTTTQPHHHTTTRPYSQYTHIHTLHTYTTTHNHMLPHTHTHTTISSPTRRSLSVVVHAYPQASTAAFRFRRFTRASEPVNR